MLKQTKNKLTIDFFLKKALILLSCFCAIVPAKAENNNDASQKDDALIDQYVRSKGNRLVIFDAQNIKLFWVSKKVVIGKDCFKVVLDSNSNHSFESLPLPIQLMNVGIDEDCTIEVISETPECSFRILDDKSKTIASSKPDQDFLHVISSSFHLDSTEKHSFKIKFSSTSQNALSIKKIILSFSKNNLHLFSPGTLKVTKDKVVLSACSFLNEKDDSVFSVIGESGKYSMVVSKNGLDISDLPVSSSVTIKNIGESQITVNYGYAPFTSLGQQIDKKNIPYKNTNKTYKIVSFEPNSNFIIVDSYPEWEKGCFVVMNAKEDLSDFPNFNFLGKVSEVIETENKQAKIVFDRPISLNPPKDSSIRLQGPDGATYLYTNSRKDLQPGETVSFTSSIKLDNNYLQFSSTALPRGTCYVKPVIYFYSKNMKEKHTIQILDYSLAF